MAKSSDIVCKADPTFVPVRFVRGLIFEGLSKRQDADQEFRKAIELAPGESLPYSMKADGFGMNSSISRDFLPELLGQERHYRMQ